MTLSYASPNVPERRNYDTLSMHFSKAATVQHVETLSRKEHTMKKTLQILGLTVSLTLGFLAFAQDDSMQSQTMAASPLHIAEHETLGSYLVDAQGRTLYVVVNGTETVPCEGDCATAWPPFTEEGMMMATESDTTMADESAMAGEDSMSEDTAMMATVDPALLATVVRADGSTQLTYNGHALYYFVGDVNPGEVNCQAVAQFGGIWYVLSPTGDVITTPNN